MVARLGDFFAQLDAVALEGESEILREHLDVEFFAVTSGQAVLLMDEATRRLLHTTAVNGVLRDAAIGVVDAAGASQLTVESVFIQDAVAEVLRSMPRDGGAKVSWTISSMRGSWARHSRM